MSSIKAVRKGFFTVTLGTIVITIVGYAFRLLLGRVLTVEEYGLVYAILGLYGVILSFAHLGLGPALVKHIAEYRAKHALSDIKSAVFASLGIRVLVSILLGGIFALGATKIAEIYLHDPSIGFLILLLAPYPLLDSVLDTVKSTAQGLQSILLYTILDMAYPVLLLVFAAILIALGYLISGVLAAHLLAVGATIVIGGTILLYKFPYLVRAKYETTTKSESIKAQAKLLFLFGLPLAITQTFSLVFGKVDTIMITAFSDLSAVGLYNIAYPTAKAVWGLGSAIVIVLLPLISQLVQQKRTSELRDGMSKLSIIALAATWPFVVLLITYPEVVISVLFGVKFAAAANTLRIMALAVTLVTLQKIYVTALTGIGKPESVTKIMFFALIVNIALNFLLIPRYAATGAAITTVISIVFIVACSAYQLGRHGVLALETGKYLKLGLSSIGLLVAALLAKSITGLAPIYDGAILITSLTILYGAVLLITRVISFTFIRQALGK